MSIEQKASNAKFEQMVKLHSICRDPGLQALLVEEMTKAVKTPTVTYKDVERRLYGPVIDLAGTFEEDEEDDAGTFEEAAARAHADTFHDEDRLIEDVATVDCENILRDVYEQSGYVVIPKVCVCDPPPTHT
jgi:hypothetical protein